MCGGLRRLILRLASIAPPRLTPAPPPLPLPNETHVQGRVKLADFGLVRSLNDRGTNTNATDDGGDAEGMCGGVAYTPAGDVVVVSQYGKVESCRDVEYLPRNDT